MSQCLTGCDASPCENPALRNPIRVLRKDWNKNPTSDQKKKGFEFYTRRFSRLRTLIARRNPSGRRKNLPNTGATQLVPTPEIIDEKTDRLLTTSHVLLQRHAGKNATLLPIWRPIFSALWVKSKRENQKGGGGVNQARQGKSARSITSHGNFVLKGPPALSVSLSKKSASRQQRNSNPSLVGPSHELAAKH
jgi:hypothetical protein